MDGLLMVDGPSMMAGQPTHLRKSRSCKWHRRYVA